MTWKKRLNEAQELFNKNFTSTSLEFNEGLSKKYKATIYIKREDTNKVRSFKIRGAFNKIATLSDEQKKSGVVCASSGNHAQGVALSCSKLRVRGIIYIPERTPQQKIDRISYFGGKWIDIKLVGDTYDQSYKEAQKYAKENNLVLVHPFNDPEVIAGQGVIGLEILESLEKEPDYIFTPIGGGGLCSGLLLAFKEIHKTKTKIIGVESDGSDAMNRSIKAKKLVTLEKLDTFIDGTAVSRVGARTFSICKKYLNSIIVVSAGAVCSKMIQLYQEDGIICEPSGALSLTALDEAKDKIKGKTVVCVLSGGNNDIGRYPEIIERSYIHQGLRHYFIVNIPQKSGSLREYLDIVIADTGISIHFFEYIKKDNKELGPILLGFQLSHKSYLNILFKKMKETGFKHEIVEPDSPLFRFLL